MENSSFSRAQIIWLVIFISAAILLRFLFLDLRPIHHDESLYAKYAYYFFANNDAGFYRYNPMLHGPFIFFFYPFAYALAGTSTLVLRVPTAILGIAFSLAPLLFRKWLPRNIIFMLIAFLSFSPLFVYYSRFLRHDYFFIASCLLMLIAQLFQKPWRYYLFTLGLCFCFCIKENAYLLTATLLFYPLLLFFLNKLYRSEITPITWRQIYILIKKNWKHLLGCLALFSFVYIYFYSAEFRYAAGVLDGLYRKSLFYWFNQHKIERIAGPFSFPFLIISWNEMPFIFMLFVSTISIIMQLPRRLKIFAICGHVFIIVASLFFTRLDCENCIIFSPFKLKIALDLWWLFFIIFQSLLSFYLHLKKKRRDLFFWSYLFWSTTFTYSFVGEKVPWLALYPLLTGLIYFSQFFADFKIDKKLCYTLTFCYITFALPMTLKTSFFQAGDKAEILSQVHTTTEFHQEMLKLKKSKDRLTLAYGPMVWPMTWYYNDNSNFHFDYKKHFQGKFETIVLKEGTPPPYPMNGMTKKTIPFRAWWVPDYDKMTLLSFLKYSFAHIPWNDPGILNVDIYTKNYLTE